jgi:hypothetical protein
MIRDCVKPELAQVRAVVFGEWPEAASRAAVM